MAHNKQDRSASRRNSIITDTNAGTYKRLSQEEKDKRFSTLENSKSEIMDDDKKTINEIINEIKIIKSNLVQIIDGMKQKRQSYFSWFAEGWSKRSLLFKIFIGLLIIVPLVLAGVFWEIPLLFACAAAAGLIYLGFGYLLSNHHAVNEEETLDELKEGVMGLADLLGDNILQLNKLNCKIEETLAVMGQENTRLKDNVDNLTTDRDNFKDRCENLSQVEIDLREEFSKVTEARQQLASLLVSMETLHKNKEKEWQEQDAENQRNLDAAGEQITKLKGIVTNLENNLQQKMKECITLSELTEKLSGINLAFEDATKQTVTKTNTFIDRHGKVLDAVSDNFHVVLGQVENTTQKYASQVELLRHTVFKSQIVPNSLLTTTKALEMH